MPLLNRFVLRPNVPSIYTEPGTDSIPPWNYKASKHWTKRSKSIIFCNSRRKANSSRDTRYHAMVFCLNILTCCALWTNSFTCPSLECNQVGAKKLQEDAESVCPYKAQWTVARSCWVLYGAWNPPTMLQMHLLTATTIFIYCKLYTLDVSIYLGRLLSLSNIILIMFAFNLFHGWCSAARIFPCGSCLHLFTVLGKQRRFYWGAMLLCCFVYLLMGVGKLNGITSVLGIQLTWSTFQQTSQ